MKKNILFLLATVLFIIGITSCNNTYGEDKFKRITKSRFVTIEESYNGGYDVVYDRKTRVMYAISTGTYNRGTFTLLVDSEGKPLLYNK